MTAMETYGLDAKAYRGDLDFDGDRETTGIVSECDAWLNARPAPAAPVANEGGFWSSAEVEAYFARRRAEDAA